MEKDFAAVSRRLERIDAHLEAFRVTLTLLAADANDPNWLLKAYDDSQENNLSVALNERRPDVFVEALQEAINSLRKWIEQGCVGNPRYRSGPLQQTPPRNDSSPSQEH